MNYLFSKRQKNIRRRIIEICYKRKFSHIGSCLTSVDIIDEIYNFKKKNEKFILSNGHAGVALYVVLEKNGIITSEIVESFNVHPDRNSKYGIDVSSGSLGQGLPIAVGIALANKKKNVYCLLSDGECMEGSIWEALRISYQQKLKNLYIVINANGFGGYGSVLTPNLIRMFQGLGYKSKVINGHNKFEIKQSLKSKTKDRPKLIVAKTEVNQFSFLKGLDAHYYLMNEEDYKLAMNLLKSK